MQLYTTEQKRSVLDWMWVRRQQRARYSATFFEQKSKVFLYTKLFQVRIRELTRYDCFKSCLESYV